jgi:hypothetical protein
MDENNENIEIEWFDYTYTGGSRFFLANLGGHSMNIEAATKGLLQWANLAGLNVIHAARGYEKILKLLDDAEIPADVKEQIRSICREYCYYSDPTPIEINERRIK